MKRERGRPTIYSRDVADRICHLLATGASLKSICRKSGFPAEATVRAWALDDLDGFSARYARARDLGADARADETLDIADKPLLGKKRKETKIGEAWVCKGCEQVCQSAWICPACGARCNWDSVLWQHSKDKSPLCEGVERPEKRWQHNDLTPLCEGIEHPERRPVVEVEVTYADMVEHRRLQIETRKWHEGKVAPKRWGTDRMEIKGLHEMDWENAPPELLDKIADHYLAKAFPDPQDAAKARKQIESGQVVQISVDKEP